MNREVKISVETTNDKGRSKKIKRKGTTKQQFEALFGLNKEVQSDLNITSSSQEKEIKTTNEQVDSVKEQIKKLKVNISYIKEVHLNICNNELDNLISNNTFKHFEENIQQINKDIYETAKLLKRIGEHVSIERGPLRDKIRQHICCVNTSIDIRKQYQEILKDIIICRKELDALSLHDAQLNIWNGSLDEEKVAYLMRTGEVVSKEILDSGNTEPEKITLKSGIVGVFKRASKNNDEISGYHSSEIAAYEIDKMLGLKMVPLTVEREIDGEEGSFQLWVNNLTAPTHDSIISKTIPGLSNDALFFDLLISHHDRSEIINHGFLANDSNRVVLYDNAAAFYKPRSDRRLSAQPFPQPSPSILKRVRQINMEMLEQIGSLYPVQKVQLLRRRDAWMQAIQYEENRKQGKGSQMQNDLAITHICRDGANLLFGTKMPENSMQFVNLLTGNKLELQW